MTTYTAIAGTEIDAESPVTEELMTRLRDNPIAITEGATGAPRVLGIALDGVYAGFGYQTSTAVTAFTGLTGAQWIRVDFTLLAGATSAALQIAFSNDGGGSYGSYQNMASASSGTSVMGVAFINITSGLTNGYTSGDNISQTLTVPSGVNAIRFISNQVDSEYGVHVCIVES